MLGSHRFQGVGEGVVKSFEQESIIIMFMCLTLECRSTPCSRQGCSKCSFPAMSSEPRDRFSRVCQPRNVSGFRLVGTLSAFIVWSGWLLELLSLLGVVMRG